MPEELHLTLQVAGSTPTPCSNTGGSSVVEQQARVPQSLVIVTSFNPQNADECHRNYIRSVSQTLVVSTFSASITLFSNDGECPKELLLPKRGRGFDPHSQGSTPCGSSVVEHDKASSPLVAVTSFEIPSPQILANAGADSIGYPECYSGRRFEPFTAARQVCLTNLVARTSFFHHLVLTPRHHVRYPSHLPFPRHR